MAIANEHSSSTRVARNARRRIASATILSVALVTHTADASDLDPKPRSTQATSHATPDARSLDVEVFTRSERGLVFCALWPSAEGYPIDRGRAAHEGMSERLARRQTRIHFESVAHGEYALACFHDENGNHTLDTNFLGIPSEGTGASNDARGFMGPPRYEAARFVVSARGPDTLSIRIDY